MENAVISRKLDIVKNAPLVLAKQVCQAYDKGASGSLVVLENVDLQLYPNEIVGLLGRSGSGKSTLLRAIAGLIRPSKGDITFEGRPVVGPNSDVAVVFQSFALFPWLTVLQNVELGLEAQGVASSERRKRALAAIDLIGLDGFESAYPKELSGGMRQRVGLARALVVRPKVLLMDEPFSALDVLTAETLRTDLLDLWCEGRMPIESVLMVTHNIEEAVLMCDRILIFGSNPGRVIAEIHVDLPQPRNRLDPAFRMLVEDIYARMTVKTGAPTREGLFPGTGIAMALPRVSTNLMSGLIETVAAEPYRGQADLPPLAAHLHLDIDDLFPVAETLQLLRFADLEGGDIKLTAPGLRFFDGDVDERKKLFEQHLATYVPLAAHIRRVLDERPTHRAPARRFRDELEDYMSEDYADTTIKAVTNWARYAEYFAYDENADLFTLENPS
ncbi:MULTISPECIES: ABC transporter ATP-binding protein [Rhizobium]|uniref:NitT/TauT family transport system ATP-binding protein n=1 Tax=Rhizobium tropici TaxID=398 RepID=A0A6P1CIB5_RHITR|nr:MULTISPECIES: nitrate/sulfonate/bicarbonate ABC transporter ATP-binding protein [Rhizobium]AGB71767.1 putative nitrate/nitrite/cyanate ABC transporter, ATP-binding protein [Rhizobium tropici CIAT 899]MBB4245106.1 NitT/TauT family transport system ATP-binding protein [Rhizobium tropici]MBB5596469.1 NitT/TauT family transport system ATP-binding protein [Rhizobium tropici]MBB6495440.1 NitT/TauT family transport system ATP-binding protein [Rhizobium tropici]NEV14514.1 nitrate/sulfonate/bicarbon